MTKLEEEMYKVINGNDWPPRLGIPLTDELHEMSVTEAKAAAEVAKRYIDKAFNAGLARTYLHQGQRKSKETWLKENGIIE